MAKRKDQTNVVATMGLAVDPTSVNVAARAVGKAFDRHITPGMSAAMEKSVKKTTESLDKLQSKAASIRSVKQQAAQVRIATQMEEKLRDAALEQNQERLDAVHEEIELQARAAEKLMQRYAYLHQQIAEHFDGSLLKGAGLAGQAFSDKADDFLQHIKTANVSGMFGAAGGMAKGGADLAKGLQFEKLGKAMAQLSIALGAIAGFAAILKLLLDIESQAKDMNKAFLEGASYLDLGVTRTQNLDKVLEDARQSAIRLAKDFRTDSGELMTFMAAANQAGLTIKEITGNFARATTEAESFDKVNKSALVNARMLGISTSEVAEQMAKWAHDYGADLDTVNENFRMIFTAAQSSGIGVKRFYTMITQATSGMALYNVHVAEAVDLTKKFAGAIGEDAAEALTQSLRQGFTSESYVDRFRRVMIAGQGDTAKIMARSAQNTAQAFMDQIKDPKTREGLQKAFTDAGIGINFELLAKGDAAELAKIGKMGEKDIRKVVSAFEATDANAARQLETMLRLGKGLQGGLTTQARALEDLDMGGKLALMLQTLGDKPLSELSAIETAAFEQYAGISGDQLKELRRLDSRLRGQWDVLKAAQEKGTPLPEDQAKLLAQMYGATVKQVDGVWKIVKASWDNQRGVVASNHELKSLGDLIQSGGEYQSKVLEDASKNAEEQAKQMYDNVNSITNILRNKVVGIMEKIYATLQTIAGVDTSAGPALEATGKSVRGSGFGYWLETAKHDLGLDEKTEKRLMTEDRQKTSKDRQKDVEKATIKANLATERMKAAEEAGLGFGLTGQELQDFVQQAMAGRLSDQYRGQLKSLDPMQAGSLAGLLTRAGVGNLGVAPTGQTIILQVDSTKVLEASVKGGFPLMGKL